MAKSTTPSTLSSDNLDSNRIEWLRMLGHPDRFRIIDLLSRTKDPLRVTDIYQTLGMSQAIASQHLILLKNRGVLSCRAVGTSRYYQVRDGVIGQLVKTLRPMMMVSEEAA